MSLEASFKVAASGMRAQAVRLRVVAENLANAEATAATPGGDPYRRKLVVFENLLDRESGTVLPRAVRLLRDQAPFELRYEPGHPAADERGFVKYPNVNPLIELMDMREAQRTYEANLNLLATARGLLLRTLDLLR